MTPEQIAYYNGLLASSISTRAQLAEQRGDWNQFRFLCGWNAAIEHARMLHDRARAFDPSAPRERHTVTYAHEFGPHRTRVCNADGEWEIKTMEDTEW